MDAATAAASSQTFSLEPRTSIPGLEAHGTRVFIRPLRTEVRTTSGIITSTNDQVAADRGEVVAVGHEVTTIPLGAIAVFDRREARDLDIRDLRLRWVKAEHVIAVLTPGEG